LKELLKRITPIDKVAAEKAGKKLDSLTKPLGSLGELEEIIKKIAGIQGKVIPDIKKKCVAIMCSDNGVVEEGISQSPSEITSIVMHNFIKGMTGINVLSDFAGADIMVIDIGVDDDIKDNAIIDRKIRRGTWNIAKGPAMTREEAVKSLKTGIDIVRKLKNEGVSIIATGEMGIGNTTTSSAIATYITGDDPEVMVGRGAGLTNKGLLHKKEVVKRAIDVNKENIKDSIDILACLGGFDIGGMAGLFIGGAIYRIPVLIDGFISAVAALIAIETDKRVKDYIIPSHISAEPGTLRVFEALSMKPYLNLNMRLGEGTGAALMFNIIDAAIYAYNNMGTFDDAKIEQYEHLE
jgi:nicotinate-nucleotide--dimethylbenzimidazole phosphoribosyltransferase